MIKLISDLVAASSYLSIVIYHNYILKKSEYKQNTHYEIFSTLLSLPTSPSQISSSAPILKHH